MCKVLMVSNTKMLTSEEKIALVNAVQTEITKTNSDGFGFAGVDEKGKFYGFKTVDYNVVYDPEQLEKINSGVVKTNEFLYFGNHDSPSDKGMIFHGRTSTNKDGIRNAHPIMLNEACLVHNGVVNSTDNIKQVLDTDTELLCYTLPAKSPRTKIENRLEGMKSNLERSISGYYAFLNLNHDGSIIVVRDSIASLYMAEVLEIDAVMIGTTVSLIEEVCKEMGWTYKSVYAVSNEVIFRVTEDNEIKNVIKFKAKGYTAYESYYSRLSLGRNLDNGYEGYEYNYNDYNTYGARTSVEHERTDTSHLKDDLSPEEQITNDAITMFLEDTELADSSWEFVRDGVRLMYEEFKALSTNEKLLCEITSPSGKHMSLAEYVDELEEMYLKSDDQKRYEEYQRRFNDPAYKKA